ncbi:MAG: trehalose synthase, partial [Actinomycetota bacterium]|nr:trehalose synthase [Actinomycetota bacterium]
MSAEHPTAVWLTQPRKAAAPAPLSDASPSHWFEREPLWFKRAIFYEIHLRGFFDGDDDGSGDLHGLVAKL